MSTRTATIRCPGCGQEIMRGAALECTFKPSVQASTYRTFDSPQERDWLCMECKYIVENHYGDLSSVTSEDAYTLLYSVRIKKGSSCSCCSSCIITQLNNYFMESKMYFCNGGAKIAFMCEHSIQFYFSFVRKAYSKTITVKPHSKGSIDYICIGWGVCINQVK